MTNTKRKLGRPPKKWPAWAEIVVDAMKPFQRKEMPIEDIFKAVEAHPVARARARKNRNVRAKVRQQLQFLRDKGRVDWVDRGVWRLP